MLLPFQLQMSALPAADLCAIRSSTGWTTSPSASFGLHRSSGGRTGGACPQVFIDPQGLMKVTHMIGMHPGAALQGARASGTQVCTAAPHSLMRLCRSFLVDPVHGTRRELCHLHTGGTHDSCYRRAVASAGLAFMLFADEIHTGTSSRIAVRKSEDVFM